MGIRLKKKTPARVNTPTPLVQAVGRQPAKGGTWSVRDSGSNPAHTDLHRGVLAVPLNDTDEPCPDCGTRNHNDAIRTHELLHVRVSPEKLDTIKVPQAMINDYLIGADRNMNVYNINGIIAIATHKWELYDHDAKTDMTVSAEALVVAEEMGIEDLRRQVDTRTRNRNDYICLPKTTKSFIELLSQRKGKDAALLVFSAGSEQYELGNKIGKIASGTYLSKFKKDPDLLSYMKERASEIYYMRRALMQVGNHVERNYELKEWHNRKRSARAVLIQLYIDKANKPQVTKQTIKQLAEEAGLDEDLLKPMQNMLDRMRGNEMEEILTGNKHKIEGNEDKRGPIRWAEMEIVRPPLVKKMPMWKLQRKNAPTDEGTIPTYMYRFAVDKRVFRRTSRNYGASVLIDDSGSMSLTVEELDEIVENVPGVIIAAYAGNDYQGRLKILAQDGKRVGPDDLKVGYGGNDVDLPALQWLASQPEPRIWVSDGQVVSPSHGFSPVVVMQCMSFARDNKINRAEDVKEAREMLTGKKMIYR